ncbi:helix-turn-helix domain-containing protein [Corallococcus exercitus]|uniref:helix-turn-helix domain-containing protein n=1 Tax=Corallococcus exercitus TaxID=2316736 RepID=UPI000EA265C3|nr:helix-turn-helix transcriptional regulator [Corallococcus exercitus]
MIRFGPWSTTLGLAAGFGALVCGLLLTASGNRSANRLLAALLGVSVLRLMPYVLGFAGFYDVHPWLSFAPFNLGLATGPLLFLYVRRLVTPTLPARAWRHFVPAAVMLGYTLCAFALPLEQKLRWNDSVHEPWIAPLEAAASMLSLAAYLVATVRFHGRYQRWLVEHVSDRDSHRQPWMATVLVSLELWWTVTVGFAFVDRFLTPLSHYDRFPQYLLFAAIVLWLGLEGWRHAGHRFPQWSLDAGPVAVPDRDWAALAAGWEARIQSAGWWREPGLTLSDVARRLGTNESYASRAFNRGLGRNFNAVINAMRVAAVQQRLASGDPTPLLTMALEAGFASKASFNRSFREHTGLSPTAWRTAQQTKNRTPPGLETTEEEVTA